MIITCPECLTKFRLDDDRIPEEGAKGRCTRCQHVFEIRKPASPEDSFFSQGENLAEFGGIDGQEGSRRKWRFPWKWAVVGVLAVLVAGGIYFFGARLLQPVSSLGKYFDEMAGSLKKVSLNLPFLKRYLGMGEAGEGYISLEKVRGYYLESNTLNRVFVVEGEAVNHWKESRSFIRVKGVLLDIQGNKVQEKEVYCGNILSEKDLKEMTKGAVEKSLSSQFGISFSNVNIQPSKGVPFMIVFTDLPPEKAPGKPSPESSAKPGEPLPKLSDFTVEVVSSQKGSK